MASRGDTYADVPVVDLVRSPARRALRYLLLVVVGVIVIGPIYATLVGALKPGDKLLDYPRSLLPVDLTTSTFTEAWRVGNLGRFLVNSFVMSASITLGQIVTSVLAAYAFAFIDFPLKRLWFILFIATLTVPAESIVLGNQKTIQSLGWIDSYQALIVPFLAFAFGTFLVRQVFLTIPKELREAAALDGVGHLRFLWEVAVPLARPAIGALGLFSFLAAWNQYLWPQRVTTDDSHRTIQIGLASLRGAQVDKLNLIMAGTIIAALPIMLALVVFQRQLIRGLTAGAVKG
jgi:sn-glycerol 3-phosphate transport system permease protein